MELIVIVVQVFLVAIYIGAVLLGSVACVLIAIRFIDKALHELDSYAARWKKK
jgi:hypothetical protein